MEDVRELRPRSSCFHGNGGIVPCPTSPCHRIHGSLQRGGSLPAAKAVSFRDLSLQQHHGCQSTSASIFAQTHSGWRDRASLHGLPTRTPGSRSKLSHPYRKKYRSHSSFGKTSRKMSRAVCRADSGLLSYWLDHARCFLDYLEITLSPGCSFDLISVPA